MYISKFYNKKYMKKDGKDYVELDGVWKEFKINPETGIPYLVEEKKKHKRGKRKWMK